MAYEFIQTTGEGMVQLIELANQLKSTAGSISAATSYSSARATGGHFMPYERMKVGENGTEIIEFDRGGSVTPAASWNPWNQTVINNTNSSNSSNGSITLVVNLGNQTLGQFVLDHVSQSIDA